MERRQFLKLVAATSVASQGLVLPRFAHAAAVDSDLRLINLLLNGGPDLRHLIVPAYDADEASYGYTYWLNRYRSHAVSGTPADWQTRYNDAYTEVTVSGETFGVLKKAQWLIDQINSGNVAIVSNAIASKTRSHSQAQLALETGIPAIDENNSAQSGWGGRLANLLDSNIVSASSQVARFCQNSNFLSSANYIIDAADSRNIPLYHAASLTDTPNGSGMRPSMSRALKSYYEAKRADIDDSSPFAKFVQQEKDIREMSDLIETILEDNPVTDTPIEALYSGDDRLNSTYFGRQIRNLHDCFLCSDPLNFRVASLNYGGWDSHGNQAAGIEPKLEDILGSGGGFATLRSHVTDSGSAEMQTRLANSVITIAGEFGRQLRANGDRGTDHGRGMNVLVIGDRVNGGLYGDLFPSSEITQYSEAGSDITGLTNIEQVFAPICEIFGTGMAEAVFPDYGTAPLEGGVDFSGIIT